jgi:hypothetical protein
LLDGAQQLAQSEPAAATQLPAGHMADEWTKLKPQITERGLRSDPDFVNTAMDLTFAIENQKTSSCGAPGEADKALALVAKLHEEN